MPRPIDITEPELAAKIEKLPMWARDLVRNLRNQRDEAIDVKNMMAERTPDQFTFMHLDQFRTSDTLHLRSTRATFGIWETRITPKGHEAQGVRDGYDVHFDALTNRLEVRNTKSGGLALYPAMSNVIRIGHAER